MTDPYSVLGITPGADDETIKKAYRQKCKQYHPDLHPDDPAAEEHFKEVQAAYSEIMRIKQGGGTAYRQGGQTYGQSSGYSQQYQDPLRAAASGSGHSASAITAPAARPGGRAMAAPPVTLNCGRRQIISAAAFMRRLSTR